MAFFDFFRKKTAEPIKQKRSIRLASGEEFREAITVGYTPLNKNPEIIAACLRISQLVASMTIYLMANTKRGDVRVVNELSRKLDIDPNSNMTRATWMTAIVNNLLLYGYGNSVVYPHTEGGRLGDMDVIAPYRVGFTTTPTRPGTYGITIDNVPYDPQNLLHFVFNPDPLYPWKGQGLTVALSDVVQNLAQAQATTKDFMSSKWKPSIIVKVDALTEAFSGKEGRKKLMEEYLETNRAGEPWLIPAEQFEVEQVRPLSLADLAISDAVQLDRKTVAAVLGVPPYLVGAGEFKQDEWTAFIDTTLRPLAQSIEQELTRKLIISPSMFVKFNMSRLYAYNLKELSGIYTGCYDKGIVTGNEVREKLGMEPLEGLDQLIVLENYIPVSEIGNQKKLK